MLEDLSLPDGLQLVRTTPEFSAQSVPSALLSAHRVATGVWGRLVVITGTITCHVDATGESRRMRTGQAQAIEPDVAHQIDVEPDATFLVEFHR